jgi:hypothetical protein
MIKCVKFIYFTQLLKAYPYQIKLEKINCSIKTFLEILIVKKNIILMTIGAQL